jgi:hypothetical protein
VRLTSIDNTLGGKSYCSVGIIVGSAGNGLVGTPITIKKTRERSYCFVANLSVRVRGQDANKLCYNVGDAEVVCAASLT